MIPAGGRTAMHAVYKAMLLWIQNAGVHVCMLETGIPAIELGLWHLNTTRKIF